MVCGKRAVAGNAKTRGRVPERLTEEVRAASQKVIQSRKDVKSAEAIRGIGVKVDVVDHPSAFEQMMPSAEGQRVSRDVQTPPSHQFRPQGLIADWSAV